MTQPDLPPSATAFFRDLERRVTELERIYSNPIIPNGPTLPRAGDRANQLFLVRDATAGLSLHFSNGTEWFPLT
jgi:hypothetical protein